MIPFSLDTLHIQFCNTLLKFSSPLLYFCTPNSPHTEAGEAPHHFIPRQPSLTWWHTGLIPQLSFWHLEMQMPSDPLLARGVNETSDHVLQRWWRQCPGIRTCFSRRNLERIQKKGANLALALICPWIHLLNYPQPAGTQMIDWVSGPWARYNWLISFLPTKD